MVRKKATKISYKVVEYRGGRVSRRSRLSLPVRVSLPSTSSSSVQGTPSCSPVGSLTNPEDQESDHDENTEFQSEESCVSSIPQFGRQSLVKKRVRQYRQRKETEMKAWANIRGKILEKYVASEAFASDTICSKNECLRKAECRCRDCGILNLMCVECCLEVHHNSLHAPEIWKESGFELFNFERGIWRKKCDEDRHGQYVENIVVINSSGFQIKIPVMFYRNEEPSITLIDYGMWPATPKEPKVAFDMCLMELAEVLFLECRLSTKQFCNALKWMVPDLHQCYISFSQLFAAQDVY